jgi:tetratricopeptide (TPR) repeat protein
MPMSFTAFVAALVAGAAPGGAPVTIVDTPLASPAEHGDLAVRALASGRDTQALATLEKAALADPHDAAVLINLGIAYARVGDDAKARAAFDRALVCHEVVELDTADGTVTDSRRLARRAIKMLDRGEFRSAPSRAGQLTLRD